MTNTFTPKQLNITPALGREKAEARLTVYGERAENFAVKQAWYLVQHADVTGRMNGEAAIAYRRLSGYQLAKLVCEVANQDLMGADVIDYMYKFMGISREVAPMTEQYLVINNVIDIDPMEFEDEIAVLNEMREVEINEGSPADYLVQRFTGKVLDYSVNGATWLAEYAPIIVDTIATDTDGDTLDSDSGEAGSVVDTMPIPAPVDAISSDLQGVQVSTTMKAKQTPQITKKERRKQKQNAIRQQYAVAMIEARRQQQLTIVPRTEYRGEVVREIKLTPTMGGYRRTA